ncbi:hypothetical protein [Pseudomonas sp. CLCA07]
MEKAKPKNLSELLSTGLAHEYSVHEALMIDEIQRALSEADNGDFVSPKELKAVISKWVTDIS